jgi:tungstate transport system ATP-binding protein
MMDVPTYRLRNVRVQHAAHPVLDLPDLALSGAGVTAIVGPNGAGKTTLLRVLAWLQPPTAGVVEFQGRPVSYRSQELAALRQQVTLIAQSPLLFRRSVHANVVYGLRMRRRAAGGRVGAALAAVGLDGFAHRSAWKLSGGEAQRVAIARALAIDPPVYLFDEPTANVDRQYIAIIESLIATLGASGKTVILTTHDLEQAYRLGEAIVSLADGRLAPFPLANLLRGTTAHIDAHTYFLSDGLQIEIPDGATPMSIAVDPEDIVVSREPLHSSARNCFSGHVAKVERDERGVMVTVDCGRPLIARITQHSYDEMALNIGTPVYVTFKSSAIHMLAASRATPRSA